MEHRKTLLLGPLVVCLYLSVSLSGRQAEPKQYTYAVKGRNVTVDFPVFIEGSDKKVTKDVFHGYQLYNSYCYRCQRNVLAIGRTPNHVLHLLLSLVTCGIWLLIWPLVAAWSIGGYRCLRCGSRV